MTVSDVYDRLPEWSKEYIYSIGQWEDDVEIRFDSAICHEVTLADRVKYDTMQLQPYQLHYDAYEYRMFYVIKQVLIKEFDNVDMIADSDTNFVNFFIRKGTVR